jgi:hypothetical protein
MANILEGIVVSKTTSSKNSIGLSFKIAEIIKSNPNKILNIDIIIIKKRVSKTNPFMVSKSNKLDYFFQNNF